MKKNVFIIILLCLYSVMSAQNNNFYYANGTAQYWEEDRNSVNIIVGNIEGKHGTKPCNFMDRGRIYTSVG